MRPIRPAARQAHRPRFGPRAPALDRLRRRAGRDHASSGVRTNLRFLRWLIAQPAMRDGEMRTDTIDRMAPPGAARAGRPGVAGRSSRLGARRTAGWPTSGAVAGAPTLRRAVRLRHGRRGAPRRARRLGSRTLDRVAVDARRARVHVDVEGQSLEFRRRAGARPSRRPCAMPRARRGPCRADGADARPGDRRAGRRRRIGRRRTTTVVVIEAMKMEHAVVTPIAGVVGNVRGARGRPGAARGPAGRGRGRAPT